MMNAMQMPMNTDAVMPMMGMNMDMPAMKCMMERSLQGDMMLCRMMPTQGMSMDMLNNCCQLMNKMMDCGMPMMMSCNGMPMMCCTC